MQVQARFGKWSLAMGVDWRLLESGAEVKAERRGHPKQQYVLRVTPSGRWLGFHSTSEQKVYAAALLVGLVVPNAVVYVPLSDAAEGAGGNSDYAWVCAVQGGLPAIQHDMVLPLAEARRQAEEWATEFDNAEVVGALPHSSMQLAELLERLEESLTYKTVSKKYVASAMLQTGGLPVKSIAIGLAVMLGVAGAYFGYEAFGEMRERERIAQAQQQEREQLSKQGARNQAELDQIRLRTRDAFEREVAMTREALRERIAPQSFLAAVNGVRQSLPLTLYGYRPTALDCTSQECRVSWQGAGRFTSATDKLRLPNVEPALTNDLSAVSVYPIGPTRHPMPSAATASSVEQLKFFMQAALAAHGSAATIEPDLQPITVKPPEGSDLPPRVIAHTGRWRLSLSGATALVDAAGWMDLLAKWPVRVLSMRQQTSGSVEASGDYVFLTEGGL